MYIQILTGASHLEDNLKDQKELIKHLESKFKEANEYRRSLEEQWVEEETFYKGDQWKVAKRRPVKNWCFTVVEGEIPILTDTRPSASIIGMEDDDIDNAKVLESGVEYVLEKERFAMKLPETVRDMLITGTGWQYVDFDPDKENGEGSITVDTLDWRHVWVDPAANELDAADFAIIKKPVRVDKLKRRFPKHADDIKPVDIPNMEESNDDYSRESRWSPGTSMTDEKSRYGGKDLTILEEYWFKDYSMEKVDEIVTMDEIAKEARQLMEGEAPDVGMYEDHEEHIEAHEELKAIIVAQNLGVSVEEVTEDVIEQLREQSPELSVMLSMIDDHLEAHRVYQEQNPKGLKPKYYNNLRLVMKQGHTVLFDGEAPVKDGMIPLVPYYCYKSADSIYGTSEVRNIISSQKSYNEMDWAELQNLRLTGNSGWVIDEESGVDSDTLTNEPGLVVKKKKGTEARRLEAGSTNPQLGARKDADQRAIEQISGINEATQGRRPAGITAAQAIRFLQEQSVGRIRLKTRYLEEYSILRLGQLISSRIIKYWTTERKLRIWDKAGQIKTLDFDPDNIQSLSYEVRVSPGSTAGLDKEAIFNVMKEMLQNQVIDPRTFFEVTDVPYKAKILERLNEQDEMQMQLEALAGENEELKAQLGIPAEGMPAEEVPLEQQV